jgi:hypothetical protein
MHPIDRVEFSAIAEETKIVVPHPLEITDESASKPFCVVAEDPDTINLSHVMEGTFYVKGWSALPPTQLERAKSLLLEGFEGDAWKYEEQVEAAVKSLRVGAVGLGKVLKAHHQCKLPIEALLEQVAKANPNSIVISTFYNPWEVGLLIAATRLLKVKPPTR